MQKDSAGRVGFQFHKGKIEALVKDSSAARNGLVTDHYLLEVQGQNVVGMTDKEILKLLETGGNVVTVTIIPSFMYEQMMKKWVSHLKYLCLRIRISNQFSLVKNDFGKAKSYVLSIQVSKRENMECGTDNRKPDKIWACSYLFF